VENVTVSNADARWVLFLCSRDHMMQYSMDEVLHKCDLGWLVMVATYTIVADNSLVGIPGHRAGDIDE
jgi:hypothetical protein